LAYQDFLRQQGYPAEQVKFLSEALKGVELPKTETTQKTEMPAQPGGYGALSQLIGGAAGIDYLTELFKKYFPPEK
jgi:hypothetical protein